jgi:hypothetical protein
MENPHLQFQQNDASLPQQRQILILLLLLLSFLSFAFIKLNPYKSINKIITLFENLNLPAFFLLFGDIVNEKNSDLSY